MAEGSFVTMPVVREGKEDGRMSVWWDLYEIKSTEYLAILKDVLVAARRFENVNYME